MEMKGFVHTRIDARLIHGQVAGMWSGFLKITRIMVVDDTIANDDTQKSLLRMVAPTGVATSIITKERALENIKAEKYKNQRVLLLVKEPRYLQYFIENGLELLEFNVGNMATREGSRRITSSISVTGEEEAIFHSLIDRGVKITVQMVPRDSVKMLKDLL